MFICVVICVFICVFIYVFVCVFICVFSFVCLSVCLCPAVTGDLDAMGMGRSGHEFTQLAYEYGQEVILSCST